MQHKHGARPKTKRDLLEHIQKLELVRAVLTKGSVPKDMGVGGVIQQDDKADLIEKPLPLPKPGKQHGIRQQLGIDESIQFEFVEEAVAAVEQAKSKQDLERLRGGWQHFEGIDAETITNAYEDKLVSLEDNDAT